MPKEALMVKLLSGETIYIWASFAGSEPAFRNITNREALEKARLLLSPSTLEELVEEPHIVALA